MLTAVCSPLTGRARPGSNRRPPAQRWQTALLAVFSGSRPGATPSRYMIVAFGHTTACLPGPATATVEPRATW